MLHARKALWTVGVPASYQASPECLLSKTKDGRLLFVGCTNYSHRTNTHHNTAFKSIAFDLIYLSMRYRQLFWMAVGIVFLVEAGQIEDVYGMPLHLSTGGSSVCDFDFGALPGLKQRSLIAYEIVFRDSASFIANSSYCNLEIWNDGEKINNLAENKRSSRKVGVRLEIENPELYKV